MGNGSINILKFVIFKLCHFKAFDDYITLHNFLNMLLTYTVRTLYHIQWAVTVVIVS